MDWVEILLQKSCDKTLQKGEVLHSLFHMIEVNEKTLDQIQTDKMQTKTNTNFDTIVT